MIWHLLRLIGLAGIEQGYRWVDDRAPWGKEHCRTCDYEQLGIYDLPCSRCWPGGHHCNYHQRRRKR